MDQSRIAQLADHLTEAYFDRREVDRLTSMPGMEKLSIEDAYRIQDAVIHRFRGRGHRPIGWKMGLTSKAKMKQMGVHSPIYGLLTDQMRLETRSRLELSRFIHPKIEPEIAFIIAKDIRGPVTTEQALAACSGVCAAMEIIDSRYKNFNFALPDVVADNCSSSAFVLGEMRKRPEEVDLGNLGMLMEANGQAAQFGSSAAIYGHPAASLAELLNLLEAHDQGLRAGEIVLAGAATQAIALEPGMEVRTTVQNLGSVSITVA